MFRDRCRLGGTGTDYEPCVIYASALTFFGTSSCGVCKCEIGVFHRFVVLVLGRVNVSEYLPVVEIDLFAFQLLHFLT